MNRAWNKIAYIYWKKETKVISLTQQEFEDKLEELYSEGRNMIKASTKTLDYYTYKTFSVEHTGNYFILKYVIKGKGPTIYSTNWFDDSKNERDFKGSDSVKIFEDKFKELNGVSLKVAYDTVEEEFKRNIPKQFSYVNPFKNIYLSASSIDASSQYPSGLFGDLPDSHTMIKLKGRVKPSEDYPFAFYSSGHIAEYNKYDTHDWLNSRFSNYLFRKGREQFPILKEDDYTILMKPSKYHMDSVWQYFYDNRKTDESFKVVMNASIGCFHKKKYRTHKFAHLAAIAIARGNQKILEMCDKIGQSNIIQICVDGIIYEGKQEFGITEKRIGEFKQEFTDCILRIDCLNRYIAMDNDKVIKYKTQGVNCYKDGTSIKLKGVTKLSDMDNWIKIDPLQKIKDKFRR